MAKNGNYFVAVVGGAISGSVAAEILAERGIKVAVIEQKLAGTKAQLEKAEDGGKPFRTEDCRGLKRGRQTEG